MPDYTPLVPQNNQKISQTTQPIQDNFNCINQAASNDHVALTDAIAANRLLHNKVTFPGFQADPATIGAVGAMYTKDNGSGAAALFFKSVAGITQLTSLGSTFADPGYANLPGGLQLRWGTQAGIGAALQDVVFSVPFTNNCLSVVATCANLAPASTNAIAVQNLSNNKFSARSNGTSNITYIAIGY